MILTKEKIKCTSNILFYSMPIKNVTDEKELPIDKLPMSIITIVYT